MRSLRIAIVLFVLAASPVRAQTSSVTPADPVTSSWLTGSPAGSNRSLGLLPSGLFDPAKFSISNTMRFGYSSGGPMQGSAGLFTSSLGYRLRPNMGLQVDVGAHLNPAYGVEGTSKGLFLQGAAFSWRPARNAIFRVEYQDMRSPLQSGYRGYGYGGYGDPWSPFYGTAIDPTLGHGGRATANDPSLN
jgi:hypothetical protein